MKIGITCYPTYGGSGIVATELGRELAARGHEIHFITYANPIRLDPGLPNSLPRSGGLHVSAVPISSVLSGSCLKDGGSVGVLRHRSSACSLRDSSFDFGPSGQADDGGPKASFHHDAARHRYYIGRFGPFLFS